MSTTTAKCRVCFCTLQATAECYDMRKLPKLAHKFATCTDLLISDELRLPSELCQRCRDQLDRLYAFRARCISADTKWRMEILAFCVDPKPLDEELEREEEEAAVEEQEQTAEACAEETPPATTGIHKCEVCGTQFLEQHRLQAHKRQHGLMPYPCPEPGCERGYSHKNTLSVHMRKCHQLGKEHKSQVCEVCGKVFDTMWRLKNHLLTHRDKSELPYVCEDSNCARRFSSKQLLKVHMMRHAGIKNYRCSYCGVRKTTRTELKIHQNYHTLERSYCCRICSKVCNSSSNLNLHMRTVHEFKSHPCSYCERTFNQASLRKQHELIHTGEKPHECEDCGRHFRQKAALRTHRKIHQRMSSETETMLTGANSMLTSSNAPTMLTVSHGTVMLGGGEGFAAQATNVNV